MPATVTPVKLDLKKDERLLIEWSDGHTSTYSLELLRTMCPCALCKTVRSGADPHALLPQARKKTSLTILPGNFAEPLTVLSAELVGNYALRLEWSDQHGSGIYSFVYLREIDPNLQKNLPPSSSDKA
jgi:DUF971 family protein